MQLAASKSDRKFLHVNIFPALFKDCALPNSDQLRTRDPKEKLKVSGPKKEFIDINLEASGRLNGEFSEMIAVNRRVTPSIFPPNSCFFITHSDTVVRFRSTSWFKSHAENAGRILVCKASESLFCYR